MIILPDSKFLESHLIFTKSRLNKLVCFQRLSVLEIHFFSEKRLIRLFFEACNYYISLIINN